MKKVIIFKKESSENLPSNYMTYLEAFICNCIKAGDCRLSPIIDNYTKDYNSSKRPFDFSELYQDYFDSPYQSFSSISVVKLTVSSSNEIINALCQGIKGKNFEVKNVSMKVLDIIEPRNEYVEELYSLV
ncbi:CRISPR/Cas system endoribonuclease Cas6 (RAMP superfamily) [Clostridium tetanomorphum]|uniref:Uncharacterized protein n=1 Tax=Clostridium tetanomorphum TaxID=1553 RepID=A0A923E691_CLOTT|nr:hypothetical protein [Clostridium tetanomorphum]KAJ50901.1 hypothetical protein CTM_15698 [Clostridium tetanomorphum DSM 665]MBC2397153.1 hypothetical protein [Clostridium tetanomorphum]MBP1863075.1 CRISPR/Cas system endoribonuclease Cas6 (RAMP superfamily) [Clostridium tetanomorphum]NRS82904.1 CRISPR/Cas system endoribonuclease Cas6 (RAMP superfamily) [Clostridium tetanomorphum]NRZ99000.1 CRISPR/Cas system endoribonuclease Cas6 (RAMP superfamily) [Clostridium tetanomorphum]